EAAHYMKFLKKQVQTLEQAAGVGGVAVAMPTKTSTPVPPPTGFNVTMNNHGTNNHSNLVRACGQPATHMVGSMELL
nr:transcription factor HEC2-like [Tanacetum cinerariifolium]